MKRTHRNKTTSAVSKNTRAASSTKINNPIEQKLCFEIPIYRCNEDKHSDEMAKEKARYLSPLSRLQSYATAERRFDEEEWYPWRYNEAKIGRASGRER